MSKPGLLFAAGLMLVSLATSLFTPQAYAQAEDERTGAIFTSAASLFGERGVTPPSIAALEPGVVKIVSIFPEVNVIGAGTGFVLNNDGHIATNAHVIEHIVERQVFGAVRQFRLESDHIYIAAANSRTVIKANVVWYDRELDLAILRAVENIGTPLPLATIELERGAFVQAIGYPGAAASRQSPQSRPQTMEDWAELQVGEAATRTDGDFSHARIEPWMPGQRTLRKLQHSAAISVGNSGGPLLDECGRVVGINTMKPNARADVRRGPNGQPEIIVTSNEGIYFSSSVLELVDVLRERNIPFTAASDACVIAREGDGPPVLLYVMSAASLISLGVAFVAFRRPAAALARSLRVGGGRGGHAQPRVQSGAQRSQPRASGRKVAIVSGLPGGRPLRIEMSEATGPDGVVIGRAQDLCSLVIEDSRVSRRHARLMWDGEQLAVEDLNATNPTSVNGQRLAPFHAAVLKAGDRIVVGATELQVSMSS